MTSITKREVIGRMYTPEQISKYLNILHEYKKDENEDEDEDVDKHICKSLEIFQGQHLCIDCGRIKGHVLGQFDINDSDRLHYQKKSIYHRKYYFEKKVNDISKIIGLKNEEKFELYEKLLEINCNNMNVVNKKFSRKRIININFIIKKILKEMECEKYKYIENKTSYKILKIYNNWWKSYKELIK